jgi:hypothetical protein
VKRWWWQCVAGLPLPLFFVLAAGLMTLALMELDLPHLP